ncbi:hypothetical protein [Rubrobacter aplysinae]|uniref:hypothetical protein n=1 Tax=Rubrobacter aplysinae TaxID=909625 RepID=UPI00128B749E|nr:hypothetical protein [Rubrobacter aplysinae]
MLTLATSLDAASEIVAILGTPFPHATLAMGTAALGYRRRIITGTAIAAEEETIGRDIGVFLALCLVTAASGLVNLPFALRVVVALVLIPI